VQHLERFGSPERIAEAKYELIAALPAGAPAVVNADDLVCLRLAERARTEGKRVVLYGMGEDVPDLAVRGTEIAVGARGSRFRVVTADGQTEAFETRLLGRWNLSNVLAGIAAALEWGVPLPAMKPAVAALVRRRAGWRSTRRAGSSVSWTWPTRTPEGRRWRWRSWPSSRAGPAS